MEFQTPLNQAHSQVRKAENFLKTRKFDEAVELQDKIVELLREALAEARNAGLETSIRAQIEFHLKQKEVIRVKAARWEEFCLAVAALQVRMNVSGDGSADADGLQVETFRLILLWLVIKILLLGLNIPNFPRDGVLVGTPPSGDPGGGHRPQPAQHRQQDAEGRQNHNRGITDGQQSPAEDGGVNVRRAGNLQEREF